MPAASERWRERHEVAVLALPNTIAFELGLPHKLLGSAVDAEERPLYRVRVATVDGGPVRTSAGYAVLPDHDLRLLETADTVVVPGVYGGPQADGVLSPALTEALTRAATHARIVSICTGAFVLGAAGVLDGLEATSHWLELDTLARFGARPVSRRVVQQGKVITAAGVSAGIDMALVLAARIAGDEVAQAIQLGLEYAPQPPFDAGTTASAPGHVVELVRRAASQFA